MGQAKQAGLGIVLLTGAAAILLLAGCAVWGRSALGELLPAVTGAWALTVAFALLFQTLLARPFERLVLCYGASMLARLALVGVAMSFARSEILPTALALSMFALELVTAAWLAPQAIRRRAC